MFSILASAANYLLGWLVRGVVIKFGVLSAIYFVISWLAETVLNRLDISPVEGLQSLLNGLPGGVLYMMGVFRFDVGIPLIVGAMLTAFLIRRIPLIG